MNASRNNPSPRHQRSRPSRAYTLGEAFEALARRAKESGFPDVETRRVERNPAGPLG